MPGLDRLERGINFAENNLSVEIEVSLQQLTKRLDGFTNDSLTERQVEIYYEGARYMRDHFDEYPQYEQYADFIDKIIETFENSLPLAEAV